MTPIDSAVSFVKQRGFARSTDLAKHLGMIPGDVDLLFAGKSVFVTCDVQVGDSKLKEYRLSTSPAHNFRAGSPVPPTPPGQASVAPTPIAHVPPAPVREAPKEKPMAEKQPVAERVVNALRLHGPCDLDTLVKHTNTPKATLYTMMGSLVKKKLIRRVHGERGVYEIETNAPRQRVALAEGAELGRRAPGDARVAYAETVKDLKRRRDSLTTEVEKLDRAIEAVEALAA